MRKKVLLVLFSTTFISSALARDVFCQCQENSNNVGVSLLFYLSGSKSLKLPNKSIQLAENFYKSKPILELYPSLRANIQKTFDNKSLPKALLDNARMKLEKKDSSYYFTSSLVCKKIKTTLKSKDRPSSCVVLHKRNL